MAGQTFYRATIAALCGLVLCSGEAAARMLDDGPLKGAQSTRGRHLLAHIEQEELRHLGRGLRADDDTYSYGEFEGYKNWGGICQQGNEIPQSPIDIPGKKFREALDNPTGDMNFNYANFTGATATNTGHGVQVNMPEGNMLTIGDQKWQLLQYQFHSPSENAIQGRLASMEIHLVHSNMDTGDLAVVAILMNAQDKPGPDRYSSALQQGLAKAPDTTNEESEPFTLNVNTFTSMLAPTGALPKGALVGAGSVPAVTFTGSLTTPPCTAGVQWYVLMKSTPVGPGQVLSFQRFLGNGTTLSLNRRPIQRSLNRDISSTILAGAMEDGEDGAPAPSPDSNTEDLDSEMSPEMAPESAMAPMVFGAGGVGAPVPAEDISAASPVPAEDGTDNNNGSPDNNVDQGFGVYTDTTGDGPGVGGAGGEGGSSTADGVDGADGADGADGVLFPL